MAQLTGSAAPEGACDPELTAACSAGRSATWSGVCRRRCRFSASRGTELEFVKSVPSGRFHTAGGHTRQSPGIQPATARMHSCEGRPGQAGCERGPFRGAGRRQSPRPPHRHTGRHRRALALPAGSARSRGGGDLGRPAACHSVLLLRGLFHILK